MSVSFFNPSATSKSYDPQKEGHIPLNKLTVRRIKVIVIENIMRKVTALWHDKILYCLPQ